MHDTSVAVAAMRFWWWDEMDSRTSAAQKGRVETGNKGHDSEAIGVDPKIFLFEAVRPLLHDQRRESGKASRGVLNGMGNV